MPSPASPPSGGVGLGWRSPAGPPGGLMPATVRTDAGDLTARRLAGGRLVTGFEGRHPPRGVKRMIRQGQVAGVILFSDNLGSRDRARRLIGRLQAIRTAQGPPRSPAGDDRPGGRPREAALGSAGRLRAGDGPPRRRIQPPPGRSHGPQPEAGRRQRQPGAGARRRSARQRNPLRAQELRRQATPRGPHGDPVRERNGAPGRGRDRQALPGPGGGGREHRPRGPADPPQAGRAATDRRATLPRLRRQRRRHGDDLNRDLHALLAQAGGLLQADRDWELRGGWGSRASRSATRWRRSRPATSAGRARSASPPRRPAPTCCCSRITMAPLGRGGR